MGRFGDSKSVIGPSILVVPVLIQVSLAIRGSNVPHKSKTANTKSYNLGLNNANLG